MCMYVCTYVLNSYTNSLWKKEWKFSSQVSMSQRPNLHLHTGRCRSPGTCAAARPCNEGAGATLTKHRQATKASQWHLWSVHYPPKWNQLIDQLRMNSWVGWCHVWPRRDSNSRPRGNACAELADERLRPLGHTGIRTVYGQTKPSETARLVS